MRVGQVIGRVTLSQQDPAYKGGRFLLTQPLSRPQLAGKEEMLPLSVANSLVVYDNLGAGVGDVISFSEGAEATAPFESPIPIDAFNCALIDRIHFQSKDL